MALVAHIKTVRDALSARVPHSIPRRSRGIGIYAAKRSSWDGACYIYPVGGWHHAPPKLVVAPSTHACIKELICLTFHHFMRNILSYRAFMVLLLHIRYQVMKPLKLTS